MPRTFLTLFAVSLLGVASCGDHSRLPVNADTGPQPVLREPTTALLPTVNIAPAKGWAHGAKPVPAAGLAVNAFATDLDHPRWIYVLPNGDVLVAETERAAAARRPQRRQGLGDGTGDEAGRCGHPEREPHHAAARRGRRRRRRDAQRSSSRA